MSQNLGRDSDSVEAAYYRRLRWRCRRGLLENDILLNRLLDRRADTGFTESEIAALDRLLDLTDPVLLDLILGRKAPEGDLSAPAVMAVLEEIRAL
ncbi:MAG: succinate dehydrogenase assembly factor 2 [Lautropia sp.]|nr:succinate dehydrogenase assembly factor 2 [Lautropia sp.]